MVDKELVKEWVNELLEGSDRFLVDVSIKNDDLILVFLDSDTSITIEHCVEVSRHIESKLNRDEEDFELRVSSSGLDHPLTLTRQFVKNIGRDIRLEMNDGASHLGKIVAADDKNLSIDLIIEKKRKKIKEQTIAGSMTVAYDDIKEAWPVISFN
jgi:ribosome maturation factor RimP